MELKTKKVLIIHHLLHQNPPQKATIVPHIPVVPDIVPPGFLFPTYFPVHDSSHEVKRRIFNNRMVLSFWVEDLEAGRAVLQTTLEHN